eukprot:TRINITY_DN7519_c0_g1_i1.p1 TRINITY_DN7519_c0_g1~~TRINITY_DN7519_c0_g1_i1.p1  ORF type:complete len:343 (-),score=70.09 TRINITY_DN7519_c0_g1_i1:17-1009(-)
MTDDASNYKVLQVDSQFLNDFESEMMFKIKGSNKIPVVLCTEDKTYSIKSVGTSNTVYFLSSNMDDDHLIVQTCVDHVLEMERTNPKLHTLKYILQNDELDLDKANTIEQLEELIQASSHEIRVELDKLNAICVLEKWFLLAEPLKQEIMNQFIKYCRSRGLDLNNLDYLSVLPNINIDAPDLIVKKCVENHCIPVDGDIVKINPEKYCILMAKSILQEKEKWSKDTFMIKWEFLVGESFEITLEMLSGLIAVDENTNTLKYLPWYELPVNHRDRFEILFATKQEWNERDIIPFVADLVQPGVTAADLLTKYARVVIDENGQKKVNKRVI